MSFNFSANNSNTPAAPAAAPFSFGGSTPAPSAPAPAPVGGFSFGSTPAPAPAPSGAPSAPAPAPTPAGGFSFGSTPAPAPAPSGTSSAPAPAPVGGFSFGSTPAPAPAPSGTPSAPAGALPSSGFSFSGTPAPAPLAPAPTLGTPAAAPGGAITPQPPATVTAPEFDSVFSNIEGWHEVQKLCAHDTNAAAQEWKHWMSTSPSSLKPKVLEWVPPNNQLRQQLSTQPTVAINGGCTTLTRKVLERVLELATDLRISEADAICLYAQIAGDPETYKQLTTTTFCEQGSAKKYPALVKLAREFYFFERHLQLQSLLTIVQSRLSFGRERLEVTDKLLKDELVSDLIKVIREYTQRIQQLQQELAQEKDTRRPANASPPSLFAQVHLLFCQQERHTAAEILLFIAYHTQLTVPEMSSIIDLTKDLSNMTPKPCPFTNVPSPYEPMDSTPQPPTAFPSATATPFQYVLKEKEPLAWQREFVLHTCQSGQPQLLQCISLLLVVGMAAMETRQVLHDRELHGPNAFGMGNQFVRPDTPSLDGVSDLHTRLTSGASSQWARQDIWGVLAASYALLLRSAPTQSTMDIREAARACLEMPVELKSFTFCRLTLIPCLQRLPSASDAVCKTSEFGLSVVSEMYSLYLSLLAEGLPISQQRWEKEEDEELKLRRTQQAQQRQFYQWSGGSNTEEVIPAAVDLMARPDCLDDIIALATSICSLGPEYSRNFWTTDAEGNLAAHRALQVLEQIQIKDDSLLSSYLSWLAALANDEASANAVHELLSKADAKVKWINLIFNLRWYAQELSPYDTNVVSKAPSTTTTTTTTKSTSYYYNLEGNAMPLYSSTTSTHTTPGESKSSSSSNKPKELSNRNRFQVSSHLAVIMNVALHSPTAQKAILSITLPVGDGGAIAGGDEALVVLFKLSIAPLSPPVRGATMATIAGLLQTSNTNEDFLKEQGKNAWEYLESCPFIPVTLLDQFLVSNNSADARAQMGLSFPPSSTALTTIGKDEKSILPKDSRYGLIYEMEHVESRMGWYPSTEGFLRLLKSLVCVAGCPMKLGQNGRIRTGCAPYLEYVLDCVLPRVLGINDYPRLPFRVQGDQSRLLSAALSVVEAILTRYSVPSKALKLKPGPTPLSLLGIQSVLDQAAHPNKIDISQEELIGDFKNISIGASFQPMENPSNVPTVSFAGTAATSESHIPHTKSPGFTILADILSSSGGTIFQAIAQVLTDHGASNGIASVFGAQSDNIALSYAVFGAVPPNMDSAKEGAKEGGATKPLQTLLKALSPEMQNSILDMTKFDDAVYWRENSIALALRILCAAAIQEDAFVQAVKASKEPLKIVPLLRFQQIRLGSSNFRVVDVSLSRLTNLFFSANNSQFLRNSLVEYIGYDSVTERLEADLAPAALSMVFFMYNTMPPNYTVRNLCGNEPEKTLSQAVARRLLSSSKRPDSAVDTQSVNLILNWILSDLRLGNVPTDGLVQVLLGLPSATIGGNWKPEGKKYATIINDCFDAILNLLKDIEYSTARNTSCVAAFCFEILFRLYDLLQHADSASLRIVIYVAERLRSVDFWQTNMLVWLSKRGVSPLLQASSTSFVEAEADPNILSCIAWLLKGLACELKLLVGFADSVAYESDLALTGRLSPRPMLCRRFLSLLFDTDEAIAYTLIEQLPLDHYSVDAALTHPPLDALRAAVFSLPGPSEVVDGYEQVNEDKVISAIQAKHSGNDLESMQLWMRDWNALVAWNSAASHLSKATYCILDVALSCSDSLNSTGINFLEGQLIGLQANGLTDLLALILRRLFAEECESRHQGMDATLLPAATCNLGNVALLLAQNIVSFKPEEAPAAADLVTVASKLSQTLKFSSDGDDSAVDAPTRYERTTVLASALSLLLRAASDAEPGFVQQYRDDFLLAARGLEKLSCFKVDANSSESRGVVSILARATFGSLVSACSDVEDTREQSFVFNCLSKSFQKSLLGLVDNLDDHICSLLQTIALQRFGAEILINAEICNSLKRGAKKYLAEEERVASKLQGTDAIYNRVSLGSPGFLLSHLKLLSALMASDSLPEEMSVRLSISVLEVLGLYKGIIRRLCCNFPSEADVLRCCMRCFVQAASIAQPAAVDERYGILSNHTTRLKELFSESGFIENGILMLCQHLWEHPLSRDLLPSLPHVLIQSGTEKESSIVSIESDKQQSWWDVLDSILVIKGVESKYSFRSPIGTNDFGYWGSKTPKKWDENKFEYSIVAADILSLGLSLLKRLDRFDVLEGSSIARGLFKCAFASHTVRSRLEEVQSSVGDIDNLMETDDLGSGNLELEVEYLKLLGKSLARCVEELLVVSYMMLGGAKENGRNALPKEVWVAIEQSGLDNKGIGGLSGLKDGTERQKLVAHLCKQIKKET